MIKFGLLDEGEQEMLRKCVVFYAAISAKEINKNFDTAAIDKITKYKIRTDLYPVVTKKDAFDLDSAKESVKRFLAELMMCRHRSRSF